MMDNLDSLAVLLKEINIPCFPVCKNTRLRIHRSESSSYNNITIEYVHPSMFVWSSNDSEGNTFGVCHSSLQMTTKIIRWYKGVE